MIRYSGKKMIQIMKTPIAHPIAFIPRFFASEYTHAAINPAMTNPTK